MLVLLVRRLNSVLEFSNISKLLFDTIFNNSEKFEVQFDTSVSKRISEANLPFTHHLKTLETSDFWYF